MDNVCMKNTQVVFLAPRTPTKRRSSSVRSRTKKTQNTNRTKESSTSRTRTSACSNSRQVRSAAVTPNKDLKTTSLNPSTATRSPEKPLRVSPSKRVARALFVEDTEESTDQNAQPTLNVNENENMSALVDMKPIPNGVHSTVPPEQHFPNAFEPPNLSTPTAISSDTHATADSKAKPTRTENDNATDAKPKPPARRNQNRNRNARKLDDDIDEEKSSTAPTTKARGSRSKPPRVGRSGRARRSFSAESERHPNHSITEYFQVVRHSARTTEKERLVCSLMLFQFLNF